MKQQLTCLKTRKFVSKPSQLPDKSFTASYGTRVTGHHSANNRVLSTIYRGIIQQKIGCTSEMCTSSSQQVHQTEANWVNYVLVQKLPVYKNKCFGISLILKDVGSI